MRLWEIMPPADLNIINRRSCYLIETAFEKAFNLLITLLKRLLLFQRLQEIIPIVNQKPMQNNLVSRKFLDYTKQEIESLHTFIWQAQPLLSKQKNNSFLFLKEVSFASDRFSGIVVFLYKSVSFHLGSARQLSKGFYWPFLPSLCFNSVLYIACTNSSLLLQLLHPRKKIFATKPEWDCHFV